MNSRWKIGAGLLLACLHAVAARAGAPEALAAVLVGEASSEGSWGMRAVACVIHNRAINRGTSLLEEAYRPKQFSCVGSRLWENARDEPTWSRALAIAEEALRGDLRDITDGATHYHSGRKPRWARNMIRTVKIGRHTFYR